jgi:hypothetical protein
VDQQPSKPPPVVTKRTALPAAGGRAADGVEGWFFMGVPAPVVDQTARGEFGGLLAGNGRGDTVVLTGKLVAGHRLDWCEVMTATRGADLALAAQPKATPPGIQIDLLSELPALDRGLLVVALAGNWCAACGNAAPFKKTYGVTWPVVPIPGSIDGLSGINPTGFPITLFLARSVADRVPCRVPRRPPRPPSSAASRPSSARTSRSCWRARALRGERTDAYDEALITSSPVACVSRFLEARGARKV